MIINVGEGWRITSDTSCWQVERKKGKNKDGSDRWSPVTYHVDFKGALVALAERKVRQIDSDVPEEIKKALDEIKREVISSAEVFAILSA